MSGGHGTRWHSGWGYRAGLTGQRARVAQGAQIDLAEEALGVTQPETLNLLHAALPDVHNGGYVPGDHGASSRRGASRSLP